MGWKRCVVLSAALLVGCGSSHREEGSKTKALGLFDDARGGIVSETEPSDGTWSPSLDIPLAAHLKEPHMNDLDDLLFYRYVRVLTTFNKTNFFLREGKAYGFEYSLLRDYERFLNRKIEKDELKLVLDFIPVPHDKLLQGLLEGKGDIAAAGLTVTPGRLAQADFTDPYLTDVDEIVVVNRSVGRIEKLEDLGGQAVFVRKSSSYHESLLALNELFTKKGVFPIHIVSADESLETEDILEIVNSGAVEMTVADSNLASIWADVFENLLVLDHLKIREGGSIAWMIRKNSPKLKESLNAFLQTRREGTLIGNIYFNRYFKQNKLIQNPLDQDGAGNRHRYEPLFRKYADRYGCDWMLIMAMAYQESRFRQDKRSPSGAVGILQIRPSTAADKHVNIRDVHLLENNIHAGVKYLAFLRDHYFNAPQIRERDAIRFSLAAYNAGPKKIREARNLAVQMGLDPDKWFRNVEMAALSLIGRETVQYVSNINKYYLLFKSERKSERLRRSAKERLTGQ